MDKIVFIGNFAGGSFGRTGDPSRTYPYFALMSDIEAEAASRGISRLVAFRDKKDAEGRMLDIRQKSADEAASASQIRTARQTKLTLGRQIRTAIEGHIGTAVRTLRWGDQVRPKALCRESAALLRAFPTGGWDAAADGRTFRVWIGSAGQTAHIVELSTV